MNRENKILVATKEKHTFTAKQVSFTTISLMLGFVISYYLIPPAATIGLTLACMTVSLLYNEIMSSAPPKTVALDTIFNLLIITINLYTTDIITIPSWFYTAVLVSACIRYYCANEAYKAKMVADSVRAYKQSFTQAMNDIKGELRIGHHKALLKFLLLNKGDTRLVILAHRDVWIQSRALFEFEDVAAIDSNQELLMQTHPDTPEYTAIKDELAKPEHAAALAV